MNTEQAKAILLLYRPGTADAAAPEFAEALQQVKHSTELCRWFDVQLAAHEKIRRPFRAIIVPQGLREQIISERPPAVGRSLSFKRVAVMCVVAVLLCFLGEPLFQKAAHWQRERAAMRFANYSEGMVLNAINAYGMDLATNNLQQIRAYFAAQHRPADYALPPSLEKATATGCVASEWHGHPVAMICFRSPGKPAEQGSDLWFFVIDRELLRDAPQNHQPQFSVVAGVPAASWTSGKQTYLVALQGDVGRLKATLQ